MGESALHPPEEVIAEQFTTADRGRIPVSRGMKFLQAAPAAYPCRSAAGGVASGGANPDQAVSAGAGVPLARTGGGGQTRLFASAPARGEA